MVKGHHTHLQDSDLHVSKAPPDGTEELEKESVMSGDLTLHSVLGKNTTVPKRSVFHKLRDKPNTND